MDTDEKIYRITENILNSTYGMEQVSKGAMLLTIAEYCIQLAMSHCDMHPETVLEFARIVVKDRKSRCQ